MTTPVTLPGPGGWRDRSAILLMIAGGVCVTFIFTAIAPVLSALGDAMGGGTRGYVVGQLTMTVPDFGLIAGGPVTGWLLSRFGARPVLAWALLLFALSGSTGLVATEPVLLLAGRFVLGFAGAAIATTTTTMIGARFVGPARQRALGFWSGIGAVSGVLSVSLAGQLASLFGGWQAPFSLYLIGLPLFVMALAALPRSRPMTVAAEAPTGPVPSLRALLPLYLGIVPVFIATFMTGVQLSFLVAANGVADPVTQSWIIASASVGSALGALSSGFVRPRIGPKANFLLFIGLMAAGNLTMGTATAPVLVAVGAWLNGAGGGMSNPHFAALVMERAPLEARARALGWLYTAMFLGSFANPFVITPLTTWLGIHGAFLVVGLALLATLIVRMMRSMPAPAPAAVGSD